MKNNLKKNQNKPKTTVEQTRVKKYLTNFSIVWKYRKYRVVHKSLDTRRCPQFIRK